MAIVRLRRATTALSIASLNYRSSAFSHLSLSKTFSHLSRSTRVPYSKHIVRTQIFKDNPRMSSSTGADDTVDIASNIASVRQRIEDAMASNDRADGSVRLVAVSKTKPVELLVAAYEVW